MAKDGQTNYEKYFGSPERVALTVAAVEEWVRRDIQLYPHPDDDESKEWYAPTAYCRLGEMLGVNFGDSAVAFLEWLEGRTE
jgi:hypothetical protein